MGITARSPSVSSNCDAVHKPWAAPYSIDFRQHRRTKGKALAEPCERSPVVVIGAQQKVAVLSLVTQSREQSNS